MLTAGAAAGQVRPTISSLWIAYGTRLTWDASGIITTAATQGTGTWDLRLGSTVVFTSGALPLTANMSSWKWTIHLDCICRIEGASVAQLWTQGWVTYAATATTDSTFQLPYNTNPPTLGTAFDNTVPNVLDSFWTESLGTATFVCEQACAVIWNPNY